MNKIYNLFIDDQINDWNEESKKFIRDPKFIDPSRQYVSVDTVEKAIEYIEENGCPLFISFDYDLGKNALGETMQSSALAKWLVKMDMDANKQFIPEGFNYQVHSANVEATNNLAILSNWLKSRETWKKDDSDDTLSY